MIRWKLWKLSRRRRKLQRRIARLEAELRALETFTEGAQEIDRDMSWVLTKEIGTAGAVAVLRHDLNETDNAIDALRHRL